MKSIIDVCAYCEASREDVVAKIAAARLAPLNEDELAEVESEALRYVLVGGNRVLLCLDDRAYPADHPLAGQLRPPMTEEEQLELLSAPIDLPPGITALAHHCPMLEFDGFPEAEATFQVERIADEDHPGYLWGKCTEGGMEVRSPIVQSDHQEAAGE
jgi:hypothetical protein